MTDLEDIPTDVLKARLQQFQQPEIPSEALHARLGQLQQERWNKEVPDFVDKAAAERAQKFMGQSQFSRSGRGNPFFYDTGKIGMEDQEAIQGQDPAYQQWHLKKAGPGRKAEADELAASIRKQFPDLPEGAESKVAEQYWGSVEEKYRKNMLESAIGDHSKPDKLQKATYWLKNVPFSPVGRMEENRVRAAMERIKAGEADGIDYDIAGRFMAAAQRVADNAKKSNDGDPLAIAKELGDNAAGLFKFGGELLAGGGLTKGIISPLGATPASAGTQLAARASLLPSFWNQQAPLATTPEQLLGNPIPKGMEGKDLPGAIGGAAVKLAILDKANFLAGKVFPGETAGKIIGRLGAQAFGDQAGTELAEYAANKLGFQDQKGPWVQYFGAEDDQSRAAARKEIEWNLLTSVAFAGKAEVAKGRIDSLANSLAKSKRSGLNAEAAMNRWIEEAKAKGELEGFRKMVGGGMAPDIPFRDVEGTRPLPEAPRTAPEPQADVPATIRPSSAPSEALEPGRGVPEPVARPEPAPEPPIQATPESPPVSTPAARPEAAPMTAGPDVRGPRAEEFLRPVEPASQPGQGSVWERMPEAQLQGMARQGVLGAKAELARRAAETEPAVKPAPEAAPPPEAASDVVEAAVQRVMTNAASLKKATQGLSPEAKAKVEERVKEARTKAGMYESKEYSAPEAKPEAKVGSPEQIRSAVDRLLDKQEKGLVKQISVSELRKELEGLTREQQDEAILDALWRDPAIQGKYHLWPSMTADPNGIRLDKRPGSDNYRTLSLIEKAAPPEAPPKGDDLAAVFKEKGLTDREVDIVKRRFIEGLTQDEVGEALGVSKQRVQQIEKKATGKLGTESMARLQKETASPLDARALREKDVEPGALGLTPEEAKSRKKVREKRSAAEIEHEANVKAFLEEKKRATRSGFQRERIEEISRTSGEGEGKPGEGRSPAEAGGELAGRLGADDALRIYREALGDVEIRLKDKNAPTKSGITYEDGKPVFYFDPDHVVKAKKGDPDWIKAGAEEEAIHRAYLDATNGKGVSATVAREAMKELSPSLKEALRGTHRVFLGGNDPKKQVGELYRMRQQLKKGGHITEFFNPEKKAAAEKVEKLLLEEDLPGLPPDLPVPSAPRVTAPTGPEGRIESIKNAVTEEKRAEKGMPPAIQDAARSFGQVWDEALTRPAAEVDALIGSLQKKARAVTDKEDAMLLRRQVELSNSYDKAIEQVAQAEASGDTQAIAEARQVEELLSGQLEALYDVNKAVGTETGRGLNARKMLAKEDFSLARMASQARAAKGTALSPEEVSKVKDLQKRIAELQGKVAEKEAAAPKEPSEPKERKKPSDPLAGIKGWYRRNISDTETATRSGDFGGKATVEAKTDPELTSLRNKLAEVRHEWAVEKQRWLRDRRSTGEKILGTGVEAINTARDIMTSFDLSATLRQGGVGVAGHPLLAKQAFAEQLQAFASEGRARDIMRKIEERPNALSGLDKRSGLAIIGDGPLEKGEDVFVSSFGHKIHGVAASGRAYRTFLNRMRAGMFDGLVSSMEKGGKKISDADAKLLAEYVNAATGRGGLGMLENSANGLATIFFSPRFQMSRLQLLTLHPLWKGILSPEGASMKARGMVASEYARSLVGAGLFYGSMGLALSAVAKDDEWGMTFDPRTSEFGKIRIGNLRIDPLAGLSQTTAFLGKFTTGDSKSGDVKGVHFPWQGSKGLKEDREARTGVAWDFMRGKFAPVFGSALDTLEIATSRKPPRNHPTTMLGDYRGVESWKDVYPAMNSGVLGNLTLPMSGEAIYDAIRKQGAAKGTALALLSLLGMGVQHYDGGKGEKPGSTISEKLIGRNRQPR